MAAFDEPVEHVLNARERARSGEVTPGELVEADHIARVRAELTRAQFESQLAREEQEKWRAIAEDRGHALERADFALQTLARVVTTLEQRAPQAPQTAAASPDLVAISRELAAATRELAAASRAVAEGRDIPAARVVGGSGSAPVRAGATKSHDEGADTAAGESVYRSGLDALEYDESEPDDAEIVSVPPHVREEAERYAQTMQAIQDYRIDLARPRHWWQFWR
jgi:hypothetical protein